MNTKFADKVFRVLLILAFVLGTVWVPNTSAGAQHDPNPTFNVIASSTNRYGRSDWVEGWDWTIGGGLVSVSVDDPGTPTSPDASKVDIEVVACAFDPSFGCFTTDFSGMHDIQAGDLVTVTQGALTKTHEVFAIAITNINPAADIVSGTADPYSSVKVMTWDGVSSANMEVTADQFGVWSTNFTDGGTETDDFDIVGGNYVSATRSDVDGDSSMFGDRVPTPNIHGSAQYDWVRAREWPSGAVVHLTINSQDFGSAIMQEPRSEWDSTSVTFHDLGGYDIQPGDLLTVTDGDQEKSLTVSFFEVTGIETDTDIVSGTGTPEAQAYVSVYQNGNNIWRRITPDIINGAWEMDFSDIVDIQAGSEGSAQERDNDGDSTWYEWSVPTPAISAFPVENYINGHNWPWGTPLQIEIDDPTTPVNPDYTGQVSDWDPNVNTFRMINFSGQYDMKPGDIVTVTNGTITKTHVVNEISISEIDINTDIVSGRAEPGSQIDSWTCDDYGCAERFVKANQDGYWSADFSILGNSPADYGIYDFKPATGVEASQADEDGDKTVVGWSVPNPGFEVVLGSNNVNGWDWSMGATVSIEVDDPSTPLNPDYQGSTVVGPASWDPNRPFFMMVTTNYDLKPGDLVTVTDGVKTKTTTIAEITLNFDIATDTLSGTTTPDAEVHVISDDGPERFTVADLSGNWAVDFSVEQNGNPVLNLVNGSAGVVAAIDEDGDRTYRGWEIPIPQCQPGDSVSGTVFEHDGIKPVPFASIQIDDYNTGEIRFVTTTDSNGTYSCSLPDGEYRILAWTEGYTHTQEYYNEAADVNAMPIHVTGGAQFANINFTITPAPAIEHFTFNLDNPLLQDLAVRQAIALGTDREGMLLDAFLPNGVYGMISNSIVVPEHWASAPASELVLYPFDPLQARAVLEAAGWVDRDGDGIRENLDGAELAFVFKTNNASFRQISSEIFRENMQNIGIRITVQFASIGEITSTRDFDIAEFAWVGCTDNEPCLGEYVSGSPYNHARFSNPDYDAAISNARTAAGDVAKLPYLFEAQHILTAELPILPLFTRYNVTPVVTPIGTNITISPESYLNIHFSEVTKEGVTTVLPTSILPVNLPPNFQLLGQVYDVGTNASFTNAMVCFAYDETGLTLEQETGIRLLHLENNSWVDVTDDGYPDTAINQVCGTVTSFSPFAVVYALNQPPTANAGPDQAAFIRDNITLDASASFDPDGDLLTYAWDLDNDGFYDDASGMTASISFSQVGGHVIGLQVTDAGGLSDVDTVVVTILPWTLKGFYQPVDMNGVYNLVKGGSTVPLKFEIFAGSTELTDIFVVRSLTYAETVCNLNAVTDEVELTATGSTSLRYDTQSGQFIYNWKTPSTAGKCYRVTLTALDGSKLVAYFKLK